MLKRLVMGKVKNERRGREREGEEVGGQSIWVWLGNDRAFINQVWKSFGKSLSSNFSRHRI